MPRKPRLEMPGIPQHLTHRGVNRAPTFVDAEDFSAYRVALARAVELHDVQVHAYVLMSNHVHLLVSACGRNSISQAMQHLGRTYVPTFNRRHGRTGTLWEGRFKSCLVDSERYLMMVYRYIELNPVRAAMVERPEYYPWSSVHGNLGLTMDGLLTPHGVFRALGQVPAERAAAYREWLNAGISADDVDLIRRHTQQECVLGGDALQASLSQAFGRPVHCRPMGRPRIRQGQE